MNEAGQKINFHYLVPRFHFPKRNKLKSFLLGKLTADGRRVEAVNYVFCDDAYLVEMNQQYLKHDTLTDIITFELSPKSQPLIADIYISIERVRENAALFTTSVKKELHRVIFHGALHLLGFKDKNSKQAEQIRNEEENFLREYSFHVKQ